MCGISGLFDTRGKRDFDGALMHRINDALHHRGPDEGSIHLQPGLAFGHRRLSIIDIATGQQPLFNADHSVGIVFNGEIYNYQALTTELTALGYQFQTKSDTEKLRGMFAFVIWDKARDQLFMARDRLGVKPMFYALLDDGTLVFGSELKALLAHPGLKRDIVPQAVEEYFALGYVAEPRTIFRQALKLPPAHTLVIKRGDQRLGQPRRYWDVNFTTDNKIDEVEAQEELTRRLREAVKLRLISEVPLGAFLSGGVDSSAVVAMMAGETNGPVKTCSMSFDDPQYNESEFAQMSDDFDLIDTLARLYDEPYADSSAIPTYRVCQLARKHVTVALSGDGGDESFGGYRRYKLHMMEERMRASLPLGLRKPLFGTLGKLYPKADWAPRVFRAKTTFQALARKLGRGLLPHHVRDPRQRAHAAVQRALQVGARRLQRARPVPAARGAREHRRSAGADPVHRHAHLPGRRHQHQGRPRLHGAFAGSARAADGPSAGRVAGHAPVPLEAARRRGQVPVQEDAGAAPSERRAVPTQDGLRRAAVALVPRPAAPAGAQLAAGRSARGFRHVRSQDRGSDGRAARERQPRSQHAAVDAADVRRLPAQRDGRVVDARGGLSSS
ncbi:asparagine synthase domain-containing protein [Ditylenchus destructor]|nr:asparagine synthase domain-containing protein [Ditylenchus destructor]